MSLKNGLKDSTAEDKYVEFQVISADGSVTTKKGVQKKAGSGDRATIVEMFADAVKKRTGQEITNEPEE